MATPINFAIEDLKTIMTNGEIYKLHLLKKKKINYKLYERKNVHIQCMKLLLLNTDESTIGSST